MQKYYRYSSTKVTGYIVHIVAIFEYAPFQITALFQNALLQTLVSKWKFSKMGFTIAFLYLDAAEVHNFKRPMLSSSFEEKDTWDLATFLSDTKQEPT